MRITKKGKELLDSGDISPESLLKFAFMTDEQLSAWNALPTKEAREKFMNELPLPVRKK